MYLIIVVTIVIKVFLNLKILMRYVNFVQMENLIMEKTSYGIIKI